ncbi:Major facilitator superfamily [Fusarium oxysporum f. sp. vasinfectum]|nr:Major facilitator superfamily [Fusarium oxysporum f. sp. vasinfectum]
MLDEIELVEDAVLKPVRPFRAWTEWIVFGRHELKSTHLRSLLPVRSWENTNAGGTLSSVGSGALGALWVLGAPRTLSDGERGCQDSDTIMCHSLLLGLAEASTYAGAIYIISSWYKPDEISKRTALFTASGQVGTMFAGVMMAAIHKGMNGMSGLQGWQWMAPSRSPIAVFGFLYFPDTPDRTQAKYLSADEKKLARSRLPPICEDGHNIMPLSLVKRVLMAPIFWVLFFWSPVCAAIEAFPFQNNFLLWLKYHSDHFTQTQINTYPLGVQAVGIVANMLAAWHMDATGQRIPAAIVAILLQVVVGSMLLVRDIPFAGTFFAFYLSGTAYAVNPLIFGWAGLILQRSGDDAVRSVTLYSMNIGSMVLWTFWGILFYSGADTPYWKKGRIVLLVCCFVMFCYMWLVYKVDKHTAKKYRDRMPGAIDPEAKLSEPVELAEQEVPTVAGRMTRSPPRRQ